MTKLALPSFDGVEIEATEDGLRIIQHDDGPAQEDHCIAVPAYAVKAFLALLMSAVEPFGEEFK